LSKITDFNPLNLYSAPQLKGYTIWILQIFLAPENKSLSGPLQIQMWRWGLLPYFLSFTFDCLAKPFYMCPAKYYLNVGNARYYFCVKDRVEPISTSQDKAHQRTKDTLMPQWFRKI